MTYSELKKEYVIETLGKGDKVILCDFATMRMMDCGDMSVNTILAFSEKPEVKFFKVVANE